MRLSYAALALALLAPIAAHAQDAPPPPPPPAPEAPPPPPPPPPVEVAPPLAPAAPAVAAAPGGAPTLNWEAQVDAYYMYNFTGDPNTQAPVGRVFDNRSNSFTLNMAKLATYMTADPVGFRIDVIYGNIGSVSNGASALFEPAGDAVAAGLYAGGLYIEQAFATLKSGIFTLDAGRFVTSASDEVIETKANWNYSRSLLFFGVPVIHTGVRLGIAINEMLAVELAVVNGWNNDPDNNPDKTFGGKIALTLPSKTTASLVTYIGKEGPAAMTGDTVMVFDLVLGQTISDTVALSLNADYWKAGDPYWFGIGLKAKLVLDESFYLVPRVEYLSSKKGAYGLDAGYAAASPITTGDAALYEGTLTAAIPVRKNYEIRLEFRGDFSDQTAFAKGGTAKKSQFTGLIGILAWLP
jgi:hypothetical protein